MPFSIRAKSTASRAPAFLVLALFALAHLACKSDHPASAGQPPDGTPKQVRAVRAAERQMGRNLTVTGTLAAFDQATLSAKVPGRVRSITVEVGSAVRRGQVVAQLESQDYQQRVEQAEGALREARARLGLSPEGTDDRVDAELIGTVRQARAALNEAQSRRDRAARLLAEGKIAATEAEAAEAAFQTALDHFHAAVEEVRTHQALLAQRRSELALARQQLAATDLRAPFDGTVHEKRAAPGDDLAAGAPLLTVVKMNPLRLRAEVPEPEAQSVQPGDRVIVRVEGGARDYEGRVRRLSPTTSDENRAIVVEAEVTNDGTLRPGASASAEIEAGGGALAVAVPASAVVNSAGIEKVITIENGKAAERPITVGRRDAEWVEILTGLGVGDAVILEPGDLQPGEAVSVEE
ncbi:MAG TPA: efflux RND transporter periplasmic adaptor subunit [Pyrinomonadaceae bacterium]|nr:efflux RND transporter periplasmic adaptor subunit [Pyrinomonadaceae bacterium]